MSRESGLTQNGTVCSSLKCCCSYSTLSDPTIITLSESTSRDSLTIMIIFMKNTIYL